MQKMLAATTHIGATNSETTMEQYIFKRRTDGVHVINLRKTWEKLILAARAIAAIENPAEVMKIRKKRDCVMTLLMSLLELPFDFLVKTNFAAFSDSSIDYKIF